MYLSANIGTGRYGSIPPNTDFEIKNSWMKSFLKILGIENDCHHIRIFAIPRRVAVKIRKYLNVTMNGSREYTIRFNIKTVPPTLCAPRLSLSTVVSVIGMSLFLWLAIFEDAPVE